MRYRKLGTSDLTVSVIAFGAWQIGDPAYWGDDAQADAEATVHAAIDEGINLFDTAEMYGGGQAEEALGRVLGARRGDVYVATKVFPDHCAPADLRKACEASLARLGMDYVDIYQVHWPFRHVPFADAYGELARLRDEGKIRHIGVSNFGRQDLDDWMAAGDCVSNQLGYSILFRAIEHEVVPACQDHGVGILAYMPLLQGLLSGRWTRADEMPQSRRRTRHFAGDRPGVRHGEPGCEELTFATIGQLAAVAEELDTTLPALALAWVLAQPGITAAIMGMRKPGQLHANLEAVDLALTPDMLAKLETITAPLKKCLGPNPDMWLSGDNARIH